MKKIFTVMAIFTVFGFVGSGSANKNSTIESVPKGKLSHIEEYTPERNCFRAQRSKEKLTIFENVKSLQASISQE